MPEIMQVSDEARAKTGLHAYSASPPRRDPPLRDLPLRDLRLLGLQLKNTVLDLIFPPSCAGCGRVDAIWCSRCHAQLESLPVERLLQSLPVTAVHAELRVISTGWHTELLQTAVQALKYENLPLLAQPLGKRLASALSETGWSVDLIIPVPMHESRLSTRGYNQAALLADELGTIVGLSVETDALQRLRDTRSQVGLSRTERLDNMAEAFHANEAQVRDRTILLIDDVATTGATLRGCADALYADGAALVFALTVSAALGNADFAASQSLQHLPDGDRYTFDNRELSIR
jgi:ComF family protein